MKPQKNSRGIILTAAGLSKRYVHKESFFSRKKEILAVKDVDLEIREGETLGLIGSSGCGKSTLAKMILRLIEPSAGTIDFLGEPISRFSSGRMKLVRRNLQIIFQSGGLVLDPKRTVGELLTEPLILHAVTNESNINKEVDRLLDSVGLSTQDRGKTIGKMSGGQVQRVLIARAISVHPKLIICDEPVSALDVSVQGQILNLLLSLKEQLDITYLFISHDLKVIRHICDRVAVMDSGEIVESGPVDSVLPYRRVAAV